MVTDVQIAKLEALALTWPERAQALAIVDQESYNLAANMIVDIGDLIKGIKEEKDPLVAAAFNTHRQLTADRTKYLDPPENARELIAKKIKAYERQQEELRAAAQREADRIQREKDEADRQRRLAEAEVVRQAEMAKQALLKQQEQEARLALALSAPTQEAAQAILETPVFTVPEVAPVEMYMEPAAPSAPVIVAPTFERAKIGLREANWKPQVVSMRMLARAVADGTVPENYIAITPALNAVVRATKNLTNIPGIRAVQE